MDESEVERILDDCVARGLVESVGGDLRASRAWKSWLTRAAETLNRQVAETGLQPVGHPIGLAVAKALRMKGELVPEESRAAYVLVLANLELASMSPEERARYDAMAGSG